MSNPLYNGCCGNQSTQEVCGDFDDEITDLGICHPYRVKLPCAPPVRPPNPCNDTAAYALFRPDLIPQYVIIATIFDQDCSPIQDENGENILGQYQTS